MLLPSSSISRDPSSSSFDLSSLYGSSGFDEVAVRSWVRGMRQDDRQTLLRMILECEYFLLSLHILIVF